LGGKGYFHGVKHLLAYLFSLSVSWVCAQEYAFSSRNVQDGLPVSTVNDIVQDPAGFLWIATEGGGVVVYDGISFTVSKLDLPSPFVSSLKIEGDSLWIGTEKGLALRVMSPSGKTKDTLYSSTGRVHFIQRINGVLWVGSRNGLFKKSGGEITRIQTLQDVYDIEILGDSLWVASREGLYLSTSAKPQKRISSLPHKTLTHSQKWGLLGSDYQKVYCLVPALSSEASDATFAPIYSKDIRSVVSVDGQLYMGSYYTGLLIFGDRGLQTYSKDNGLVDPKLRTVFVDNQGSVWLGGLASLTRFVEPELSLLTREDGLPESEVWSVYSGESTWLGMSQGIVSLPSQNHSKNIPLSRAATGIVLAMAEWEGQLYLATESGLWVKSKNQALTPIGYNMGLPQDFVFSVCTHKGELVVATGSGLYITQRGRFSPIDMDNAIITQVLSDSNLLYIVTANKGIFTFSDDRVQSISIPEIPLDSTTITHVAVNHGSLYLGTSNRGLYLLEEEGVFHLEQTDGLTSNLIWSVLAIDSSQLWVGTEKGVQALLKKGGRWWPQSVLGGQNSEITLECNVGAVSHDPILNKIYWGTTQGLARVDLSSLCFDNPQQPVQISRIDLFFNTETDWSSYAKPSKAWSATPENLQLPYDQNYLRFKYVQPIASDELEYRYRLIGQDASWTLAGSSMEAVFTNIPSGRFTFSVQSKGVHQEWPEYQTTYSFSIAPPFWYTWWFIALLAIALGGSTVFYIQFRIKRAQSQLDLENQMMDLERKALRLQMNPHFVFNALDAISGFIFKNEPQSAVKYLNSFAKLMRLTLETSREHFIPLESEVRLLSHYLELEALRFKGKFTYDLTISPDLDTYEVAIPPMLIQPHIENAILHGLRPKETQDGKVTIVFEPLEEDTLKCTISDNGIGREKSKEKAVQETGKKSLATEITQERIALMNKTNTFKLSFEILDLKESNGDAIGTQVVLIIPTEEDF